MSGYITSLEPGTARAVAMPPVGRTSGSARPWITSVGTRTRPRSHVRSLLAAMATVWRAAPSGRQLRANASSPIARAAVGVEVRAGRQPEHLDAPLDGVVGVAGRQLAAACAAATA